MRVKNQGRSAATGHTRLGALDTSTGYSTLKTLLSELANILFERGVTPLQFNALATRAFLEAAMKSSRFRNGRINQSRMSVSTGLRRAEVRKLLGHTGTAAFSENQYRAPIESVIHGWCTDNRYTDKIGAPRRLIVVGRKPSFSTLVKKYAGDLPHRAVLEELIRLGLVRQIGLCIEVKNLSALRHRQDLSSLARVVPVIVDAIRVAGRTRPRDDPPTARRLVLPANNLFELATLRHRCTSSIEAMLDGLGGSLNPQGPRSRRVKQAKHSCSVSVIFAEDRNA